MPTLKMTRGMEAGRVYELVQQEVLVGSGIRNDIVLNDTDVSPKHCRFVHENGLVRLYDLGSKRGTFVAGKLVLSEGMDLARPLIIELGETVAFEFHPGDDTQRDERITTDRLKRDGSIAAYYLVIRRTTENTPDIHPLDTAIVTIGRELTNDIILPEPKVSRHHLRLERVNKGYILHDLKTSNGTFVNRHKIELPTLLQVGDFVAIADAVEMWFTDNLDAFKT